MERPFDSSPLSIDRLEDRNNALLLSLEDAHKKRLSDPVSVAETERRHDLPLEEPERWDGMS